MEVRIMVNGIRYTEEGLSVTVYTKNKEFFVDINGNVMPFMPSSREQISTLIMQNSSFEIQHHLSNLWAHIVITSRIREFDSLDVVFQNGTKLPTYTYLHGTYSHCPKCGSPIQADSIACSVCLDSASICADCNTPTLYPVRAINTEGATVHYCRPCAANHHICIDCDHETDDYTVTADNVTYCQDCYDNANLYVCNHCNDVYSDSLTEVNGEFVCESCLNELYTQCEDCEEYVLTTDINSDGNIYLCNNCLDNYYTCDNCREFVHADYVCSNDDGFYCSSCFEDLPQTINEYNYRPNFCFHGTGPLFYGLEIEIDSGTNPQRCAEDMLDIAGQEKHFYLVHDGSLDNGLEFVTMPCSLDYHRTEFTRYYEHLQKTAREHGFCSHDTSTCGLHIHVSRDTLTETDATYLIYLYEKFFPDFLKLSRRKFENLVKWASRYTDEEIPNLHDVDVAKKECNSRYKCINLENSETVEFRFFRGTLKIETILASIELIDNMVYTVQHCTDITLVTMRDILYAKETAYLVDYAKSRNALV